MIGSIHLTPWMNSQFEDAQAKNLDGVALTHILSQMDNFGLVSVVEGEIEGEI